MKTRSLYLSCVVLLTIMHSAQAQTTNRGLSIGKKTPPHQSAILDIQSTERGVLLPRMTQDQRDAIPVNSGSHGLMIYQTDNTSGLYIYLIDDATQQGSWTGLILSADLRGIESVLAENNNANKRSLENLKQLLADTIGIGTTTPTERLDVAGKIRMQTATETTDGDDIVATKGYVDGIVGNAPVKFIDGTKESDAVYTTGNVGIGTADPTQKLHVEGNSYFSDSLGIGTTSPSVKLDVSVIDNTNDFVKTIKLATNGADPNFQLFSTSGVAGASTNAIVARLGLNYVVNNTYNGVINFHRGSGSHNGALSFGTGGNERVRITSGGSVGIGTASPSATLHVQGTTSFRNASNKYDTWFPYTDNKTYISGEEIILRTKTSNSERMRILSDGKVGIGTSSPGSTLEVRGNTSLQNASGKYHSWFPYTDNKAYVSGKEVHLRTSTDGSDHTRMVITSGGSVGIGTTNPQVRFEVNGNTRITGTLRVSGSNALQVPQSSRPSGKVAADISGSYFQSWANNYITYDHRWTQDNLPTSSVWVDNRLSARRVLVYSDKRIKTILGPSAPFSDLEKLRRIRIINYKFTDSLRKGNRVHKKVIAQELKHVYPNAVSIDKEPVMIPSIYTIGRVAQQKGKQITIEIPTPHKLQANDHVELHIGKNVVRANVASVTDTNVFVATLAKTDKTPNKGDLIFVYGKEINDFHSVDYDALTTLNISATQEIAKQLKETSTQLSQAQQTITWLLVGGLIMLSGLLVFFLLFRRDIQLRLQAKQPLSHSV